MKLRWLAVPVVAGAAYYALFGGEYSLLEMRRLESEKKTEAARLEQTRGDVNQLRAWADSLEHDSSTLERIAREQYGMIKEGERLYRFVDADSARLDSLRRDSLRQNKKPTAN